MLAAVDKASMVFRVLQEGLLETTDKAVAEATGEEEANILITEEEAEEGEEAEAEDIKAFQMINKTKARKDRIMDCKFNSSSRTSVLYKHKINEVVIVVVAMEEVIVAVVVTEEAIVAVVDKTNNSINKPMDHLIQIFRVAHQIHIPNKIPRSLSNAGSSIKATLFAETQCVANVTSCQAVSSQTSKHAFQ